jgi:hypothetical protein
MKYYYYNKIMKSTGTTAILMLLYSSVSGI